jgi:hypothetical protein
MKRFFNKIPFETKDREKSKTFTVAASACRESGRTHRGHDPYAGVKA